MTRSFLFNVATPDELPSGSGWTAAIEMLGLRFFDLGQTCERLGIKATWETVGWREIRVTTDDYGYTALRLAYGERFVDELTPQ